MTKQEFLDRLGPLAQKDMRETGILASLTLAQAVLESAWGTSGLTQNANNLFGIKGSYQGQSYTCPTFEYVDGRRVETLAAFCKYPSWEESVRDHSGLFLRLERYENLRGEREWREACRKVQADGYATAPNYADSLIRLIEQYRLYQYDVQPKWAVRIQHFTRWEEAEETAGWIRALGLYNEIHTDPENGKYVVEVFHFSDKARADALAELLNHQRYSVVRQTV